MLTLSGSDEKQSTCFLFVGANSSTSKTGGLITSNTSLICATNPDGGLDTCSFYSGPSDETIAFIGSSYSDSGECTGTIADASYSGVFGTSGSGECAGAIASDSGSSFGGGGTCSVGGGCSYSC